MRWRRRLAGGPSRRPVAPAALALVLLAAAAGCGQTVAPSGTSVQLLGSWTGSEADAFLAVIRPFEERTGIRVDYTSTRDLRGAIADGVASGHPADLAGLEGPAHLRELADQGALRDLGDVLDLQAYKQSVAPTFVNLGSVNGELLGVFVKATVKGLIWYNPAVFQRGTPADFTDLQWMSERYSADGVRPWCVGLGSDESSGWPGTDIIESFLIHDSGVEAYDRWVDGELAWTSDEVRTAFQAYGRLVADDAVYGGVDAVLETPFENAGDPLFSDPPGCLFLHQGSFMPRFFDADGHEAGIDYDFMPFPDVDSAGAGSVIGGGDLFGLLTDNPAARDLLRYLVDLEAQELLVSSGSALSVDRRVTAYPNQVVEREAELLTSAQHFRFDASDAMPAEVNAAFWQAVLDYTAEPGRLPALLERVDGLRSNPNG